MPTYGYRCTACRHGFGRFQKMTDAPVNACESCGEAVKRILYPVGIQFKGTGFYVTDYTNKGSEKSNGAAKGGENGSGGSEGSAESKADTKSDTNSETKT